MKTMNKLLSLFLCAVIVFSMFPAQVFATGTDEHDHSDHNETAGQTADVDLNADVSADGDSELTNVPGGGDVRSF